MNTSRARHWKQSYTSTQTQTEQHKQITVKVRKKRWITKGEKVLYSLIGICLIMSGFMIVSYSSATDAINRDIQTLEQTINEQHVQNENLHFEVKELSKPERIMSIAEENGLKIQDTKVKRAHIINN